MKKIMLIGVSFAFLSASFSQIAYYDAVKLYNLLDNNHHFKNGAAQKDSIFTILSKYLENGVTDPLTLGNSSNNPFLYQFFASIRTLGSNFNQTNLRSNVASSITGLDVTNIVNGIADLMIERAKEELTITFFNRFKKFAQGHEEFRILFPKTTDNLNSLLSYTYSQMLPVLRNGFFDDLKQITYHLEAVLELPDYQKLLANVPEVKVAIKSLQIVHDLEDGSSNAADIIKKFSSIAEWNDPKGGLFFKNMGSCLKITSILSESLRNDSTINPGKNIWVTSQNIKRLVTDTFLAKIYMGLIYQQLKQQRLQYYNTLSDSTAMTVFFAVQINSILFFQNKIAEFISITTKVSDALDSMKSKQSKTNDDYYNYVNISIEAIDYAFSIVKIFDKKFETADYLSIVKKSNALYKDVYTKQYTQAISDGIDILTQVHILIDNSNASIVNKDDFLSKLLLFVEKVKPYALFIANMAEAKSSADVKAALENVILPVGSSSIKKNTKCNISIQSYLGAYLSTSNGSNSSLGSWSDKFGVTAPIGISWTPGFSSLQNGGSFSLFGVLFDIGAIVDYKLTKDSTFNSSSPNSTVVTKNYSIKLGQLFSPGAYLVYGFAWNLPLAIGFGGQYGPGLSQIKASNNSAAVANPYWRWNLYLAVDLPFFNLLNKNKTSK
jgi:hypothetical protein